MIFPLIVTLPVQSLFKAPVYSMLIQTVHVLLSGSRCYNLHAKNHLNLFLYHKHTAVLLTERWNMTEGAV